MESRYQQDKEPTKRKPGRPPKKYTGRKAAKVRREAVWKAEQYTEEKLPLTSVINDSTIQLTGNVDVQARAWMLERYRVGYQKLLTRDSEVGSYIPDFLDSINRLETNWRQIATVRTMDVTYWFDLQLNDYNSKAFSSSPAVEITWIGHPFLSSKGAHARRFLVDWKNPLPFPRSMKELAISRRKPVMRWTYVCNGTCSALPGSRKWKGNSVVELADTTLDSTDFSDHPTELETSDEEWDETRSWSSYSGGALEYAAHGVVRQRGQKCSGDVKLHLEILAHNLEFVNIWQQNNHPDATPEQGLTWSRGLHNEVGYALRLYGVRPFTVMQNIVKSYGFPEDIAGRILQGSSILFPNTFPSWRLPSYRQVTNMLPAIKRRARLDKDPFAAVALMYEKHLDKIYCYVDHNKNAPDSESEFSCAIATEFSLETLILHGSEDGLGLDTSWRNKNEHRAAVSFLIAVDREGHLTPGSVLISANVKAYTIAKYLDSTEARVIKRAHTIVKGGLDSIKHPRRQDKKDILKKSEWIDNHRQWSIRKWMIDKSSSLLAGIKRHHQGALILVCQFHIVQAIIRVDGGNGRVPNAPKIPYRVKFEIVKAFREVQRCRSMEQWPDFYQKFMTALQDIIMSSRGGEELEPEDEECFSDEGNKDNLLQLGHKISRPPQRRPQSKGRGLLLLDRQRMLDFWREFFDKYWFNSNWLSHITDIGLPDGETRDGTFYTNNWCEAAFQTFDKVFLKQTENKRLDRLVAIIIGDFFPFYESLDPRTPNIPWDVLEANSEAYQLWDTNKVRLLGDRNYLVAVLRGQELETYMVNLVRPECQLNCKQWNQTGKACVHIRAARLHEANGPVSEWEKIEISNQRILHSSLSRSKQAVQLHRKEPSEVSGVLYEPSRRLPSDGPLERQLARMIDELKSSNNYGHIPPPAQKSSCSDSGSISEPSKPRNRISMPRSRYKDGFRSGWSAMPGRPGRIPPMAPYRRKSSQCKHIQFSFKRGKKRGQRLHPKSLFTTDLFESQKQPKHAIKKCLPRKLRKAPRKNVTECLPIVQSSIDLQTLRELPAFSPTPVTQVSIHSSLDSGLTQEEIQIGSFDLSRWKDPAYTLRVEEIELLVEILNSYSKENKLPRWYGISGSGGLYEQNVLAALTSEKETQETDFHKHICNELTSRPINSLVFLELSPNTFHWTCWEYHVSLGDSVVCRGINSLSTSSYLEAVNRNHHLLIVAAYLRLKSQNILEHTPPTEYDGLNTGFQTDQSSCGFWAVFAALLPLMGLRIDFITPPPLLQLKFWLGRLWTTYLTHIDGVPGNVIIDIHTELATDVGGYILPQPTQTIAPRRRGRSLLFRLPDIPDLKEEEENEYLSRLTDPNYKLIIAREILDSIEFTRLLDSSGWISETIINAYLGIFIKDRELECGVTGIQAPWYIASTTVTGIISARKTDPPFCPSGTLRKQILWFPDCNIFELKDLLLPWHVSRQTFKHWILIHIQPRMQRIQVYDSLGNDTQNYHRLACQRVLKFLSYEHEQWFPGFKLPSQWNENLSSFLLQNNVLGPNQPDKASCGLFVIQNIEDLCSGHAQANSKIFSSTNIQEIRRKVALRLSREDYIPSKEILFSPSPEPLPIAIAAADTNQISRINPSLLSDRSPVQVFNNVNSAGTKEPSITDLTKRPEMNKEKLIIHIPSLKRRKQESTKVDSISPRRLRPRKK